MIDIWSFAFGLILGVIGIVLEGYALYGHIKETEWIYENQIRRRDDWIQCLESELSKLKEERAKADAGSQDRRRSRQAGV